ncbi:helix-turn-helix domain-containing protein [Actinopolymorpha sp. B11F2]|uniref:helix-turn-helix domain-containing protein n=1 Tax=Actinopolymorpha sp. B11F2 TaxID=3160862 RepID=UPI0032E4DAE3
MFEVLGLTATETALYTALINNPRSTATELAGHVGISEQEADHAAHHLVRRGLANRLPGAEPRYLAVAPDIALDPLIARHDEQLRQARQSSHELLAAFRESSRHIHPAELIEVITGTDNIISRVLHFQETARVQLRGFDRPPYAMRPGSGRSTEVRRLAEGVTYRVIYTPEALTWPGRAGSDIRAGCEHGEQARVRPDLPVKLIIVDDRQAFVPVHTGRNQVEAALVVHPCDLFDALVALFESEWERAVPLRSFVPGDEHPGYPSQPDETTAALLLCLSAGLTDTNIARSLDSSLRTTQRHIQRLMRELNASTRFQAGVEARERGWA